MYAHHADFPNAHKNLIFGSDIVQQPSETRIREPELLEMQNRIRQIFPRTSRRSLTLADQFGHVRLRKLTGKLGPLAIRHIGLRQHLGLAGTIYQCNRQVALAINLIDHLTCINRCQNTWRHISRQAKDAAQTRAASIQSEHQTGRLGRAPVDIGINAKGAMIATQKRGFSFNKFEIRPPHERAIGKHPYFALGATVRMGKSHNNSATAIGETIQSNLCQASLATAPSGASIEATR